MSKTIKVELDALDLVTLIRVCHYVESDYRKLSESSNLKYGERETFIYRAYELNRLASRLDYFYQSQKVSEVCCKQLKKVLVNGVD